MRWVYRYLVGYAVLSLPREGYLALLNVLLREGISVQALSASGDLFRVTLLRRDLLRLPPELHGEIVCERGVIVSLSALSRRVGLLLGILLGALLVLASSLTVWRVEVMGNQLVSAFEIESALSAGGVGVGAFIPGIDKEAAGTHLVRALEELSFASIYVRGTTLSVEVREAAPPLAEADKTGYCNLVATADGVIESVRVEHGRAAVSSGMTVRRGDLLISGIYRTAGGLTLASAAGEVRAVVERSVTVVQDREITEKAYGKEGLASLSLSFFGKDIKLFKSYGKSEEKYDIIKRKEQVVLFGRLALPICVLREYRVPYSLHTVTLTEEEAVRAAYSRIRSELVRTLLDAELLRQSFVGEWTESGFSLTCRAECIADIAAPLAYEVESQ